ncbi:hypothetical protein PR048_014124 [Dryococelus australis]|uniref:Integrase catalytic domain-containing protein n=1 Tax=Dryococelus australis TaxID=614101 RepID=A0ABQ9HDK4_9NEOP|nr:hypothetical protein PR048_014124 [Dryococelus australis]
MKHLPLSVARIPGKKKKEPGKFRLVLDYHLLNKKIKVDPFPMPNIEILFQYLSEISVIDLNLAFNIVNVGRQCLSRILNKILEDFQFKFVVPLTGIGLMYCFASDPQIIWECEKERKRAPKPLRPMILRYFHDSPVEFFCYECQYAKQPLNSKVGIFSRYCVMLPMGDMKASSVCERIGKEVFKIFGINELLMLDNASYFMREGGGVIPDLCFSWGVKQVHASTYYCCQNFIAQLNKLIKCTLTIYHHAKQSRWYEEIALLNFAFNSVPMIPLGKPQKWIQKTIKVGDLIVCRRVTQSKKVDYFFLPNKLSFSYYGPYSVKVFLTPGMVSLEDPSNVFVVWKVHVSALTQYMTKTT